MQTVVLEQWEGMEYRRDAYLRLLLQIPITIRSLSTCSARSGSLVERQRAAQQLGNRVESYQAVLDHRDMGYGYGEIRRG